MSPFQTSYGDDALLEAVCGVTRYAAPTAPRAVPPADFDAARTAAGHPRLPAAKQIVRRLGLGWYELLELVHATSGGTSTSASVSPAVPRRAR